MWERSRVKRRRGVEDGDRRAAWRRGGRLLDGSIQDRSVENRNRQVCVSPQDLCVMTRPTLFSTHRDSPDDPIHGVRLVHQQKGEKAIQVGCGRRGAGGWQHHFAAGDPTACSSAPRGSWHGRPPGNTSWLSGLLPSYNCYTSCWWWHCDSPGWVWQSILPTATIVDTSRASGEEGRGGACPATQTWLSRGSAIRTRRRRVQGAAEVSRKRARCWVRRQAAC